MSLIVEPYADASAAEWDAFVLDESVNGTLFHTRRFLGYHPPGRFEDASIAVRDGDKLVCVVPACRAGDGVFSHAGSTHGGPVIRASHYRVKPLAALLERIVAHYQGRLGMRIAPSVFGARRNDPLIYLLGRDHTVTRELSVYRVLDRDDGDYVAGIARPRMRTAVRSLLRRGFAVAPAARDDDYREFYRLLAANLAARHDVAPTHTVDELLELRRRLGGAQLLLLGRDDGGALRAGTWLIAANLRAWHTFYIARDPACGPGAVPCVLAHAMQLAAEAGARFLSLGISTEDRGRRMNLGLFDFKEGVGGRTINRYVIEPR